jgi:hypothetical protein
MAAVNQFLPRNVQRPATASMHGSSAVLESFVALDASVTQGERGPVALRPRFSPGVPIRINVAEVKNTVTHL